MFVTCDKGKEGKCIPEAVDLFTQVSTLNRTVDGRGSGENVGGFDIIIDCIPSDMLSIRVSSSPTVATRVPTPAPTRMKISKPKSDEKSRG